jgi:hypothetical protein
MVEAAYGTKLGQKLTRTELADELGLVKTGPLASEVRLPQAFLVVEQTSKVLNKRIEVGRSYLGDLETC